MRVFLNGKFVPEQEAVVSVFDRCFTLGDGLFEALPVYRGKIFLWQEHLERLLTGANFLKIRIPFSPLELHEFAERLLSENRAGDCILRIHLSRGVGQRGYSIKGANSPTLVMSLHPAVKDLAAAKIITSTVCILADDPMTRFKASNKLPQILARMEADEQGADEALLLNSNGDIAEATSANLFWMEGQTVCTPPINSSALPGVTRDCVLNLCRDLKIPSEQKNITPKRLPNADGVFLTSVAVEIREVSHLDGFELRRSPIPRRLREAYLNYAQSAN